ASLLWVAQEHGLRRIASLYRRDFGIYRLPGGQAPHKHRPHGPGSQHQGWGTGAGLGRERAAII
ncbi:MAG: hypothetical protein ACK535_14540, partial [Cyanobacteriota bacterium]